MVLSQDVLPVFAMYNLGSNLTFVFVRNLEVFQLNGVAMMGDACLGLDLPEVGIKNENNNYLKYFYNNMGQYMDFGFSERIALWEFFSEKFRGRSSTRIRESIRAEIRADLYQRESMWIRAKKIIKKYKFFLECSGPWTIQGPFLNG